MTLSFDLVDRPWIPIRWLDGTTERVGLRAALTQAPRIASLECATPLHQIALLRLLLAFMHRGARLADLDAAVERLEGEWPDQLLAAYLDQYRSRLDLYAADRPFLQLPWLATHSKTRDRRHALSRMISEWSSGNSKTLMDHHRDAEVCWEPPEELAQILVTHQQFAAGGLSRVFRTAAIRAPAMGFVQIWAMGDTLAETLSLNQLAQSDAAYASDVPPWEADPPTPADLEMDAPPFPGPASRYAHLSRGVLLLPREDGFCAELHWSEGIARREDDQTADPMEAMRRAKDGAWLSVRLDVDRAFWRESRSILLTSDQRPPATVRHAVDVLTEAGRSAALSLGVGGLLTGKARAAKLVLWRLEMFRAPVAALRTPVLHDAVRSAVEKADGVGYRLKMALSELAKYLLRGDGTADEGDISRVVETLPGLRQYWQTLDLCFPRFIARLDAPAAADPALQDWFDTLQAASDLAWQESVRSIGTSRRALIAVAQAGSTFLKIRQDLATNPAVTA